MVGESVFTVKLLKQDGKYKIYYYYGGGEMVMLAMVKSEDMAKKIARSLHDNISARLEEQEREGE